MRAVRPFIRWLLIFFHVIIGVLLTIILLRGKTPPRGPISRLITWWLGGIAWIFGCRIKVYGKPLREKTLFVANHITWMDIPVLGSLVPLHFLSKLEVKALPVVGWLATRSGTLYIHRGNRESASQAVVEITRALDENSNCLVFAEGRTTDGTEVARFHGRLLQSAIDAHAIIQPVAIYYPARHPQTGALISNPATLFVDDMGIGESLRLLLPEKRIEVEVHYLEPIECRNRTRNELAAHAYDEVTEAISRIRRSAASG